MVGDLFHFGEVFGGDHPKLGIFLALGKNITIVYRTFQMKDTKFKVGDDFNIKKGLSLPNLKSSEESEATLDESNWYCSSNR